MTSYEQLADFVENRMRMSHVYQPVMLLTLLRAAGGKSSTTQIARSILAHDESQVEYYEDVTKNRHLSFREDYSYRKEGE